MTVSRFQIFLYLFFFGILAIYGSRALYEAQLHIIKLVFVSISLACTLSFIRLSVSGSSFYNLSVFLLIVFFCSSIYGLSINGFTTTLPTLFRYLLVFSFLVVVNQTTISGFSFVNLDRLMICLVVFLAVFAGIQIASGNLILKTSVYRLSSVYGDNVTGFSLFMTTAFLYFYHRLNNKFSAKHLFFALLCFSMMLGTQSRIALLSCFVLSMLYHVLRLRVSFRSVVFTPVLVGFLVFLAYFVIIDLNVAPRVLETFEYGFRDASSQSRLIAWSSVLDSMSYNEVILGLGPGGFHHRYQVLTGVEGMDAHFDFVKIYAENGLISLVIYLLVLFVFVLKLLIRVSRTRSGQDALAVIVFLNMFIFSAFHNAYYYFESLLLGGLIIGVVLSYKNDASTGVVPVGAERQVL